MNEVKTPKKPLIFYYVMVFLLLMMLNFMAIPWMAERQVREVDYGTFMTMTEDKKIAKVEIDESEIVFTDKDGNIYKTGPMNDPDLVQRLHDSGAEFASQIVEQMSPFLSALLGWIVPIAIFMIIGQVMYKRLMDKAGGGGNAMMFGMGKSNAKVYVKSSEGIKFTDVAGEDEAKENLTEIVDYLHNPDKYREIGASMPKGILLVGPPGTGKTMLAKVSPERRTYRFSRCRDLNLWKCLSAWALQRCVTCSARRKRKHHVSYLLMRLTPSAKSVTEIWAEMMSVSRHSISFSRKWMVLRATQE